MFITKNGKGDLAVMSIEAYEEMTSRFELYRQMKEAMEYIQNSLNLKLYISHNYFI